MRYLFLMLFIGCTIKPKFKIGDCIIEKGLEDFEEEEILQVENVGKEKYKLNRVGSLKYTYTSIKYFRTADDDYIKTRCPKTIVETGGFIGIDPKTFFSDGSNNITI